ncbi:SPOR domain-containing protein [Polaribacter sp.]|uniref:SPOR domain-containing protein n=1 Tax=Polaribacter sp. TaxID=1920175 RepID=UPI003F6C3179
MKDIVFLSFLFVFLLFSTANISAQSITKTDPKIKRLIEKKRAFNASYGYGYRIQIYYGNETKAKTVLNKFKLDFPEVYTKLDYDKPDWKVQVGNYKTKLEADKALLTLSEEFSGLIVIP